MPCGSDDDPTPDVDIDADGSADGFALGSPTMDDHGHTTQIVCISREAHLIVNGNSVGKCPWVGGRNHVYTYYADDDCDGQIDDDEGNGRPDELGWTVMVSLDGPLPPIANVSYGERVWIDGEIVDITADNYGELTDPDGVPIDTDQDGLVDVTAYFSHDDEVTKRHFEIDPHTGDITEDEDAEVTFAPTAPYLVPDDLGGYPAIASASVASDSVASISIPNIAMPNVSGADASVANVSIDTHWLLRGMVVRTTEELQVSGTTYALPAEVTNGLPLEVESTHDGFMFYFVAMTSSGSISLQIDDSTRSERGWTGVPEVLLDGDRVANASRDVAGTVVVEAGFSAKRIMTLEVRFPAKP